MKYKSVVVLTGAGISQESGLTTFRDQNGLWEGHPVQAVATPEGFQADPDLVYRFYNERRRQLTSEAVRPNAAHKALAHYEAEMSVEPDCSFTLITQNVDNLHEQAGSQRVLHMHGELLKARCLNTGRVHEVTADFDSLTPCPCCHLGHSLRPDIVWFGEIPMHMKQIEHAIEHCDLFVAIGTSGHVYPAAGFVSMANEHLAHTVELNIEPSQQQNAFKEHHYGKATQSVPSFLQHLL
jgi:NAD-dependent deacetylase